MPFVAFEPRVPVVPRVLVPQCRGASLWGAMGAMGTARPSESLGVWPQGLAREVTSTWHSLGVPPQMAPPTLLGARLRIPYLVEYYWSSEKKTCSHSNSNMEVVLSPKKVRKIGKNRY